MAKKEKNLSAKQPVVVLVGHVDHGKSSILQSIRDFKILEQESGGITQKIGAYEVEENDKKITFIDTPGHEAFSVMRARGAKVADIAVLVVAADDGVKPQTKEAISHIKEAKIPVIVALNKIDIPRANPEKVKDELAKNDISIEDRGGEVPCVETSAKTKQGISELLELILLVAEMKELEADFSGPAKGVVVESFLSARRGPMATLLLEQGLLKKGDVVGTASAVGKIKRMENFLGQEVESIQPGQGVLILGFEKVPIIGEAFSLYSSLEEARAKIEEKETSKETLASVNPEQEVLNLILKTDFLGSIEPIEKVLESIPQEKVVLKILKAGAGEINLADLKLAETSKGVILGFRTNVSSRIEELAKTKRIKILIFDLIYDLVEGMRKLMKKTIKPEKVRVDLGKLKALIIFKTQGKRQVVGAKVLEGEVEKGLRVEVFREEEMAGRGKIISLEKDKKELGKGTKGDEVGFLYEGTVKIKEDDVLVVYKEEMRQIEV